MGTIFKNCNSVWKSTRWMIKLWYSLYVKQVKQCKYQWGVTQGSFVLIIGVNNNNNNNKEAIQCPTQVVTLL